MALEPTGVSLQAKGFNEYIQKLDAIEKKNREVFDAQYKGTGKTYAEVTRAARQYEKELKSVADAQKKAEAEARKLAEAQKKAAEKAAEAQIKAARKAKIEAEKLAVAQKTAEATQRQAFISTAQAAINFAKQVGEAAFELGKLGAQYQGQQTGLSNLSASFGQSGKDIQRAIQDASKGTLSGLDAIQAANQGLLLGVAKTPAEFEKLTSTALTLGRTLGLESTQAIEQFTSALGRQSLLILDNFGVSAKQVNAEIERLARADFGVARSELTEAQKQATFMKAALNIAGDAAARIGDEAGNAQAAFDRLTAASENFKTELGVALSELNQSLGVTETITREINKVTDSLKILRAGAENAPLDLQIEATEIKIQSLQKTLEATRADAERGGGGLFGTSFLSGLTESAIESQEKLLAELQGQLDQLNFQKAAEDAKKFNDNLDDTPPIVEDNTKAVETLQGALRQAEQLQLSFARAAEDAALKQARALEDLARKRGREEEDIARKQAKSIAELQDKQKRDRDKLLKDQQKQLDRFEKDRQKQIGKAESDIAKARKEANDKRKEDQRKLQRELQRAQERFNLSRLQSERRFALAERRLQAEGDILGLQQLREDRELERKEEQENFDQSKKEQVKSAEEQQREQAKDLQSRVSELKANLEEQRAELLQSFDEQLSEQVQAQAEAQAQQQKNFEDQAAERAIALAREEEDRKIALEREEFDRRASQARQLEDLGRSLAEQKDVTAQGVNAIAGEIENVFGMEGVANNIIVGFSERTRSEFDDLVSNVEDTLKKLEGLGKKRKIDTPLVALTGDTGRPAEPDIVPIPRGGVPAFQEGGVVPGPIGSPQIIQAHAGETILPTHQRSFQMAAPVIPSQNLNVSMSGGFNISGDGAANDEILRLAAQEMTENFRIAVQRIARRN